MHYQWLSHFHTATDAIKLQNPIQEVMPFELFCDCTAYLSKEQELVQIKHGKNQKISTGDVYQAILYRDAVPGISG